MNYKALFKNLPFPAIIVKCDDPVYTISDLNDSCSQIIDAPLHSLIGKSIFDVFPGDLNNPEEKNAHLLMQSFQKVVEDKKEHVMERIKVENDPMITEGTASKLYDLTNVPVIDDSGEVGHILHVVRDTTKEHQQAEEIIRNEKRFRALVEYGNDVLWILSEEGIPKYSSPSVKKVLGYSQQEIMEMDVSSILHPDDREHVFSEISESLQKPGETITVTPARMRHKEGGWRWFGGTITNLLHDPAIAGIVDNFKDITEEVEAKQALQSFINSINGIFFEATPDGVYFNYVSPQVEEILGYKPKDWLDSKNFWGRHIHPDDRKSSVEYCREQTEQGKDHTFDYRFKKADGSYIWLRDLISVITEQGKPRVLQGLMIDITEEKKLEQQLELVYESARIGNWEIDFRHDTLSWSRFVKELHEVPLHYKPTFEEAINFYDGEHRDKISNILADLQKTGGSFSEELKIITAKGNEKWIRAVGQAEMQDGKCVKMFGSTQDVTERKLAELQRNEAEQNFRNVVEHSTNMFYTHNADGDLTYMSPQSKDFLGVIPEESDKRWTEFVTDHPVNKIGHELTEEALSTGKTQPPYELQLQREDGKIIWVEVNEAPLVQDGVVTALVGSLTDITDRKLFEEKLKESLERYNLVTKATRDAIYDWDIENDHLEWGESFTTMFGYEINVKKYPIKKWAACLHPNDHEEIISDLKNTLYQTRNKRWSVEYRFRKQNGEYAYVIEDGYILRNDDGTPHRMVGAIRDISDMKHQEEHLIESLKEKETLLAEIHHRVKNNLAVVSGLMEMQAINTDNEELHQRLIESVLRIKSIAEIHERLYQSDSFAHIQFSEGIKSLTKDIVRTLKTSTKIDLKFNMDQTELNINQSVPCSLLINEVITNILKHAFKGIDDGTIAVNLNEKDSRLKLEIVDNGNGLPEDFHSKTYTSMGLKLIDLLAEQLEADISHQTEGELTTFTLLFEKANIKGSGSSMIS
jgi:PAS domain S-box-containing protein